MSALARHRLPYDALSDVLMAVAAATYTPTHRKLIAE